MWKKFGKNLSRQRSRRTPCKGNMIRGINMLYGSERNTCLFQACSIFSFFISHPKSIFIMFLTSAIIFYLLLSGLVCVYYLGVLSNSKQDAHQEWKERSAICSWSYIGVVNIICCIYKQILKLTYRILSRSSASMFWNKCIFAKLFMK